jgi:hypothetical protein
VQHITSSLVLNEWQKTHSSSNTLIGVGGLNPVVPSLTSNLPSFPKPLRILVLLALTPGDAFFYNKKAIRSEC